ncbi:MAG: hypothetical protein KA712_02580 [Myxococcales bacterium]|nr:hypothetical protein [Myxococcales bacterium]
MLGPAMLGSALVAKIGIHRLQMAGGAVAWRFVDPGSSPVPVPKAAGKAMNLDLPGGGHLLQQLGAIESVQSGNKDAVPTLAIQLFDDDWVPKLELWRSGFFGREALDLGAMLESSLNRWPGPRRLVDVAADGRSLKLSLKGGNEYQQNSLVRTIVIAR